ncbi:MAG TPA: hypothetical protein VIX17_09425 [Pyrinomonadaceae bacterium]
MRRIAPQLFAQLFCFSLLLLFVTDSQAQVRIQPKMGRHVMQSGDLEYREVNTEIDLKYQLLAEQAVQADFRKIQLLNIDLLKLVRRSAPEKEIGSTLGEIKKLAIRLRSGLRVPKIEESTLYDLTFLPGVLLLDKTITSFVENPLFQERRLVDPELSIRAGKDITEIVRLSDFLRKLTKGN